MPTDHNSIGWGPWSLNGQSDADQNGIRILGIDAGVVGLGTAPSLPEALQRLHGGVHVGPAATPGRRIVIPKLQTRSRSHARNFAAAMDPERVGVGPLEFAGLLWADDEAPGDEDLSTTVTLFARPDGVGIAGDVNAFGSPSVIGLTDATWFADDPVFYGPAVIHNQPTAVTGKSWSVTNPGNVDGGDRFVGGHTWTATITAVTTVIRPYVLSGTRVTFRDVTLAPGQTLTIPANRCPHIGSLGAVGYSGSPSRPQPDWPVIEAGETRTFSVGAQSGTFTASVEVRGAYA